MIFKGRPALCKFYWTTDGSSCHTTAILLLTDLIRWGWRFGGLLARLTILLSRQWWQWWHNLRWWPGCQGKTNWVTYNLAGLYWRMKGNAFESIECLRWVFYQHHFAMADCFWYYKKDEGDNNYDCPKNIRRAIYFGEESQSREARPVSLIRFFRISLPPPKIIII